MAQRRPTLLMIAGPNGAGKTTLSRTLLAQPAFQNFTYINPDQIAQDLFGDWNDPTARSRAALHAANMVRTALNAADNFAIETVLSASGVKLIQRAKAAGYLVRFHYVGTDDPTINLARVAARVSRSGHNIPTDTIVRRYHDAMHTLPSAMALVDHGHVYDNSREDQRMRRLFRTFPQRPVQDFTTDIPAWARPTRDALEP